MLRPCSAFSLICSGPRSARMGAAPVPDGDAAEAQRLPLLSKKTAETPRADVEDYDNTKCTWHCVKEEVK